MLPSRYFPIHHSIIILPLDAACCSLDAETIIRVSHEERSIFWEVITLAIRSKRMYIYMFPILIGFRDFQPSAPKLLPRKRYYLLFLIPVFIVQVTKLVHVRSEVFTAVTMKKAVFWDVAPCRSSVTRRFGGTSVNTTSTRCHIPEDCFLQSWYSLPSTIHFRKFHRQHHCTSQLV
jgi:hypothetical protein